MQLDTQKVLRGVNELTLYQALLISTNRRLGSTRGKRAAIEGINALLAFVNDQLRESNHGRSRKAQRR